LFSPTNQSFNNHFCHNCKQGGPLLAGQMDGLYTVESSLVATVPPMSSEKTLPKKNSSWYVNLVLIVLAAAFIITSFDRPMRFWSPTVLTIGHKKYNLKDLRDRVRDHQALLALQGQSMGGQDVVALLGAVQNNLLLDIEADGLGLRTSRHKAEAWLKQAPAFQDETGAPNAQRMEDFLSKAGISLSRLVTAVQKHLIRQRLQDALTGQVTVPAEAVTLTAEGLYQQRWGAYTEVPLPAQPKTSPSTELLQGLFKKTPLQRPAQRKFSFIWIAHRSLPENQGPATQKELDRRPKNISQSQWANEIAKSRKTDRVAAMQDAIDAQLAEGKDLEAIGKAYGAKVNQVMTDALGSFPAQNDQAAARQDKKSVPGTSQAPAEQAEVLAFSQAQDKAQALRSGLLEKVFTMSVGQSEMVSPVPGHTLVVRLDQDLPGQAMTFEEAKPNLVKQAIQDLRVQEAMASAEKMARLLREGAVNDQKNQASQAIAGKKNPKGRLLAGQKAPKGARGGVGDFDQSATLKAELMKKMISIGPLTQTDPSRDLPAQVTKALFDMDLGGVQVVVVQTPKDESAPASSTGPARIFVVRLVSIKSGPEATAKAAPVQAFLKQDFQLTMLQLYMKNLQRKYPISWNEKALSNSPQS
jgi:hypothetical protein